MNIWSPIFYVVALQNQQEIYRNETKRKKKHSETFSLKTQTRASTSSFTKFFLTRDSEKTEALRIKV